MEPDQKKVLDYLNSISDRPWDECLGEFTKAELAEQFGEIPAGYVYVTNDTSETAMLFRRRTMADNPEFQRALEMARAAL